MSKSGYGLARLAGVLSPEIFEALVEARPQLGPRLPRAKILAELQRLGGPTTDPVLQLLTWLDGLSVFELHIGCAHARSLCRGLPTSTLRRAIPIGVGPSDAQIWIDSEGVVYDDTDLERVVPVGRGAEGLLRYWLLGVRGNRWSGAVHTHVAQVEGQAKAIARRLRQPPEGPAYGDGLSIWPVGAPAICDAIDQARSVFTTVTTISSGERERFVDALLTLSSGQSKLRLRIELSTSPRDRPGPHETVLRRIPAHDPFRAELDGTLCIVETTTRERRLRVERPGQKKRRR